MGFVQYHFCRKGGSRSTRRKPSRCWLISYLKPQKFLSPMGFKPRTPDRGNERSNCWATASDSTPLKGVCSHTQTETAGHTHTDGQIKFVSSHTPTESYDSKISWNVIQISLNHSARVRDTFLWVELKINTDTNILNALKSIGLHACKLISMRYLV